MKTLLSVLLLCGALSVKAVPILTIEYVQHDGIGKLWATYSGEPADATWMHEIWDGLVNLNAPQPFPSTLLHAGLIDNNFHFFVGVHTYALTFDTPGGTIEVSGQYEVRAANVVVPDAGDTVLLLGLGLLSLAAIHGLFPMAASSTKM